MKAKLLLLFFVLTPFVAFAQEQTSAYAKQTPAAMSARDRNVQVMLEIFRTLEERDSSRRNVDEREEALYQPDVEFHWPAALPYGGTFRGKDAAIWSGTWNPLQPTATERKMDPQIIGADEHQVVILYRQRGVSPSGDRFDGEVIGLYELRDFKLSRAQMFYFDEAALAQFLERAAQELKQTKP
jgi:ketosteroid isomerase-like protein